MSAESNETAVASARSANRLAIVALAKPVLAAALGIDGGVIFQVLATEDLGLSSQMIGLAFGLGLFSLPIQLWASRMPFRLSVSNLRWFFIIAAAQSAILAGLVGFGAEGTVAGLALLMTIVSEVAISVLFVTAWQPLLSRTLDSTKRQHINGPVSAIGKLILAGTLVIFSAGDPMQRTLLLLAFAVISLLIAMTLRGVPVDTAPDRRPELKPTERSGSGRGLVPILVTMSMLNLGALPIWLVYLDQVAWEGAPLGIIGAAQVAASVAALFAWRSTVHGLGSRAIFGACVLGLGTLGLLCIGVRAQGSFEHGIVFATTILMSFGVNFTSLAILEMAHRMVSRGGDTVRVFTIIDVVDSSSLQLGLFAGGWLAAQDAVFAGVSAYSVFVIAANALAVIATVWTVRLAAVSARRSGTASMVHRTHSGEYDDWA